MHIGNSWEDLLKEEFSKPYYKNIMETLEKEKKIYRIFPKEEDVFNSIKFVDYKDVKVVILGQDPYHGYGQADGFSFSVQPGVKIPPSLLNIYKELNNDLGCYIPNNGYLKKWAKQGVLLLNTSLTVREGQANSHKDLGWHILTDKIIQLLGERKEPLVFILWGNNARSKKKLIKNKEHLIIESVHPSPLAAYRGFFGSKPFSKTNEFLAKNNIEIIDWQIENIGE